MHTILGKLITHIIVALNLSFVVHNCFDKRGIAYCNILIGSVIPIYTANVYRGLHGDQGFFLQYLQGKPYDNYRISL